MTSVKKRMMRIGLAAMVLLLVISAAGVAAYAEECGYWSEQIDEEGRVVRVFTYTEPVVITEIEGEPMEPVEETEAQPIEEMVETPVYMARAEAPSSAVGQATGLTAGMLILGVVFLAGFAVALYKAV